MVAYLGDVVFTLLLEGDHTFGQAAGAEGMGRAIESAQESGMGTVAVGNSSHFGTGTYFALMAAHQQCTPWNRITGFLCQLYLSSSIVLESEKGIGFYELSYTG